MRNPTIVLIAAALEFGMVLLTANGADEPASQVVRKTIEAGHGGNFTYRFFQHGVEVAFQTTPPYWDDILTESGRVPDGPVVEYYGDGKTIEAEMTYVSNRLHGEFRTYDTNGNLDIHCTYSNGMKQGVLRNYLESGKIRQETEYQEGKRWGTEKEWYSNGKLDRVSEWVNGELHGMAYTYHGNGQIRSAMSFVNGKIASVGTNFYDNGAVQRCTYYEGSDHTRREDEYHPNGALMATTTYVKYKRQGTVKRYFDNGQLSAETPYTNDLISGVVREYHRNGQLWAKRPYDRGKISGIAEKYATNGTLLESMSYSAGVLDGTATFYYSTGVVKAVEEYLAGTCILVSLYDPEGLLISSDDAKKDGIRRVYGKGGRLDLECEYVDGTRTATIQREFDREGRLKKETPYLANHIEGCVREFIEGWLWKESLYIAGQLHGESRIYRSDGSLFDVTLFDHDVLQSRKRYHPNGRLEGETYFNDGKRQGLERHYFSNGNLQVSCQYETGNQIGVTTLYDEAGWKRAELQKEKESKVVTIRSFHPNGHAKNTRTMQGDLLLDEHGDPMNGPLRTLYADGSLESEVILKDGKPAGRDYTEFHSNGQKKYEGSFIYDMPFFIEIQHAYDDQGRRIDLPKEKSARHLLF